MNRSVPRLPACFYNSDNLWILSDSNVQDTSPVGTRRPFTPCSCFTHNKHIQFSQHWIFTIVF
jgi:hypothetical protein